MTNNVYYYSILNLIGLAYTYLFKGTHSPLTFLTQAGAGTHFHYTLPDKGMTSMSRKKDPDAILKSGTAAGLEENFKKAVSEMLLLSLLSEKEMYVGEITEAMEQRSEGAYTISYPYAIIYRMSRLMYIREAGRRNADDGRLRQFYSITDNGKAYLHELQETYSRMAGSVTKILSAEK